MAIEPGSRVCTENSDSGVLVMQSADERIRHDAPDRLNGTRHPRVLVQGTMCSRFIVVAGIRAQDPAQVLLAEDHEMVDALAADWANQPFGKLLPTR